MSATVENLICFIVGRRSELGLTQRELARASGLNPGTLANIEVGRVTKAPTISTLQKLAKGLRVPESQLLAIARGERTFSDESQYTAAGTPEKIRSLVKEAGTQQELLIYDEAASMGLVFPVLLEPSFWALEAQERRLMFLLLEQAIAETKRFYRTQHASINGHSV